MAILQPGSIVESWCSKHGSGKKTRHVYQTLAPQLVCLECQPEKDPNPPEEAEEVKSEMVCAQTYKQMEMFA